MLLAYLDAIALTERLHRQFLEMVKVELENNGMHDINNVQAMILYNIGDHEMTIGELTLRGCYLGSNVSYNVKKMLENDYIVRSAPPRSSLGPRPLVRQGHGACATWSCKWSNAISVSRPKPARRADPGPRHRHFPPARPVLDPVADRRQPPRAPVARGVTAVFDSVTKWPASAGHFFCPRVQFIGRNEREIRAPRIFIQPPIRLGPAKAGHPRIFSCASRKT